MKSFTTQPFRIGFLGAAGDNAHVLFETTTGFVRREDDTEHTFTRPFICPWILADIAKACGHERNPIDGEKFTLTFWDEAPSAPAYQVWVKRFSRRTVSYGPSPQASNYFPYPDMSIELNELLPVTEAPQEFWVLLNRLN